MEETEDKYLYSKVFLGLYGVIICLRKPGQLGFTGRVLVFGLWVALGLATSYLEKLAREIKLKLLLPLPPKYPTRD